MLPFNIKKNSFFFLFYNKKLKKLLTGVASIIKMILVVMVIAMIVGKKKHDKNNSLAPGQCAEMRKDQKQKEEVKMSSGNIMLLQQCHEHSYHKELEKERNKSSF